jgi:aromatic-L-amino-acid decarboxylase
MPDGEAGDADRFAPLADRAETLAALTEVIAAAWDSFQRPRPVEPGLDEALSGRLALPLPELPTPAREALADATTILDESVSPSRPLFLGYIGSTGLEVGVLAAALTATYDVNLAVTARAADLVEKQTLDWVGEFIGFPADEGAFTSGGMTSNLTALLIARERALPGCRVHGFDGRRGAIYCSDESHYSVVRAAEAAGIGSAAVRRLPIDARRRMVVGELGPTIEQDLATGVVPVAVVATAGTTLTGAVDPIDAIAEVCEQLGVWLHIDGAYGLPAAATAEAAPLFAGLERADSITLDAHKWLGLQKSCSVVLVREAGHMEATFGHEESYLRREEVRNAVERTLEYSRPLRSLKLWLAFRVHGAESFRAWIASTLGLARLLAEMVDADPDFELLNDPTLSTVCFRHLGPARSGDLDAHNSALAAATREDGRVYLASAVVDDKTCLRVCFVNFRTRPEDVTMLLTTLRELGDDSALEALPPGIE